MRINLLFISVVLAFFTQSCVEGNTQETEQEEVLNQRVDSLFLAGIPQGKLANPLLEEVSGLVASQRYPTASMCIRIVEEKLRYLCWTR